MIALVPCSGCGITEWRNGIYVNVTHGVNHCGSCKKSSPDESEYYFCSESCLSKHLNEKGLVKLPGAVK